MVIVAPPADTSEDMFHTNIPGSVAVLLLGFIFQGLWDKLVSVVDIHGGGIELGSRETGQAAELLEFISDGIWHPGA